MLAKAKKANQINLLILFVSLSKVVNNINLFIMKKLEKFGKICKNKLSLGKG